MAALISNWMMTFEGLQFSTKEFYLMVEKRIKAHSVPAIKMSIVNYKEGGILSASRQYMRVQYHDLAFEICAAPFGNDFFVSWWFGSTSNMQKDLARKLFKGLAQDTSTYYKLDTQAMFKENVRLAVARSIDEMTAGKGFKVVDAKTWQIAEPA